MCEAYREQRTDLTLQPERGHSLKLGLLQPTRHPLEGLAARLELAPGLGVPQEVGQRALRPAQNPLGEDGLGDAVPLQLGDDPLGNVPGVDLLPAAASAALRAGQHALAGRGRGGRRRVEVFAHLGDLLAWVVVRLVVLAVEVRVVAGVVLVSLHFVQLVPDGHVASSQARWGHLSAEIGRSAEEAPPVDVVTAVEHLPAAAVGAVTQTTIAVHGGSQA